VIYEAGGSAGVCFLRLEAEGAERTKKIVLLK